MPKFAANLSMLFTEVSFMERFALARQAGFTAVEYLFPYEYDANELKARLTENGLKQILFNLPAGDWAGGDRGIAASPDRVEEFRAGVARAVEYALVLGAERLNLLGGKRVAGYSDEEHWAVLVDNARYAARKLAEKGLNLVIENINHYDIPGVFISRSEQVFKLIDEVGLPNVFAQYDIYHAQRMEGELTATLRQHIAKIGHIQVADNPGRHQPGTGEINFPFLFKEIDALGYSGYIGLEYVPAPDTQSSLGWMADYCTN
ncbi:MAG: hydroxypyruvate isomerase [Negativicutes bacterium]|nr:hydroxypyruvate isomerase [Negativicutes bacterium]